MSEHKSCSKFAVKSADRGEVEAVFSTFDVVDSDGDVTVPGAFEDGAAVRISAYGHRSWMGDLPVGKGVIRAGESEAVLDGRFFLETTPGKETFRTIKGMDDLQEWSFGYDVLESESGERDGQPVRFLKKLKVHEVSPVLLGAGVNTRTLAVKSDANGDGRGPGDDVVALLIEATDAIVAEGNAVMDAIEAERAADSELEGEKRRHDAIVDGIDASPLERAKRRVRAECAGPWRYRFVDERRVPACKRSAAALAVVLASADLGIPPPPLVWFERVGDAGPLLEQEFKFAAAHRGLAAPSEPWAIFVEHSQAEADVFETVAHEIWHVFAARRPFCRTGDLEEHAVSYGRGARRWRTSGAKLVELDGPLWELAADTVAAGTVVLDRGEKRAWRRTETPAKLGNGFAPPGGTRALWSEAVFSS